MKLIKAIAILIAAVIAIIAVTTGASNLLQPTFNPDDYEVKTIRIDYGDTIDGYYYEYADTENTNIAEYREQILKLNNLRNCTIYAGDKIKVYVKK